MPPLRWSLMLMLQPLPLISHIIAISYHFHYAGLLSLIPLRFIIDITDAIRCWYFWLLIISTAFIIAMAGHWASIAAHAIGFRHWPLHWCWYVYCWLAFIYAIIITAFLFSLIHYYFFTPSVSPRWYSLEIHSCFSLLRITLAISYNIFFFIFSLRHMLRLLLPLLFHLLAIVLPHIDVAPLPSLIIDYLLSLAPLSFIILIHTPLRSYYWYIHYYAITLLISHSANTTIMILYCLISFFFLLPLFHITPLITLDYHFHY